MSKLIILHGDKSKDEFSSKTQQNVDELDYLVTLNRIISQAMARTIQKLSECIFINMAKLTLAQHPEIKYLKDVSV